MKKVIMINGSPRPNGGTSTAFAALRQGMEEAGVQVKEYQLNQLTFKGCQGCMGCKGSEGCVIKDELTPILEELKDADGLVLGSPIYMFAVSGQTSLFINRLYSLIDGGYQPYAGKARKLMTVYSMGSPSAGYATTEQNRVCQAMDMLGFKEADRIQMTGIFPGQIACQLTEKEFTKLQERGKKFVKKESL
ncbi:flavodoxin family protein [Anaerosporobacter sp.]